MMMAKRWLSLHLPLNKTLKMLPPVLASLPGEDLQRKPVQNLKDVLKEVPGVQLTNEGDNRKGVSIRGLDSSYTLILVDGKRVNSRNAVFRHNDFDLNWIPVDSIERIEVVRGPMSSLYGSDALGGVVNIITKKSVRNGRVPLPSIPPFRNIAIAVIPITVSSLPADH